MPPHAERQAPPGDEGNDAQCGLHRLHRHTLAGEGPATSLEVFGGYIHTYKFSEGVEDEVVLDLVYEARDIDQRLSSEEKIDEWFQAKTKGLNDWQKDELKNKWGTMQEVLSSRSRMDRVVSDIIFDFSVKPSFQANAAMRFL